ncbi:hypothetical protein H6P81_020806 [Aristolochia fimbriata]|uniref:Uncharacterized protein n=1 Tax=Aristolochia fimbriata TaxID=158543 RepID=A0AAV7DYD9_ARIFI|nr:hypothetical protein H6P81_020806 [Aristolochia fimbriata]
MEMSLTRVHSCEEMILKLLPGPAAAAQGKTETTQKGYVEELKIPPPPCPFPAPERSLSRRRRRREDPFLAAYMECTRAEDKLGRNGNRSKKGLLLRGVLMGLCSSKRSCEVTEDNLRRSVSRSSLLSTATKEDDEFAMN